MPDPRDVWIIVPSYDGRALTLDCLRHILPQAANRAQVLVVDNASSDGTGVAIRAAYPTVSILRLFPNRGFVGAVNAGVEEARRNGAQFAVIVPNDNAVEEGWLEALLSAAEASPQAAVIMPVTIDEHLDVRLQKCEGTLNVAGRNVMLRWEHSTGRPKHVFYPCGNGAILRLDSVGVPCDPDFGAYYDDVEMGWRHRLRGYEIVLQPAARLRHFGGGTMRRFPFQRVFLAERNRLLTLLMFFGRATLARLLPILAIDCILCWLAPKKLSPRVAALFWILSSAPLVLRKRKCLQASRRVAEEEILSWMSSQVVHFFSPGARWINAISRLYARLTGLATGQ